MFNNKFSRLLPHPGYNVGGGIGEAALIGAAFSGGKALITGEDPLQAALLGGVTGGAMAGVTGAIPGLDKLGTTTAGNVTSAATPSVQGTISNGVIQGANTGLNVANTVNPALTSTASQGIPTALAPNTASINSGIAGIPVTQPAPQVIAQAVPVTAEQTAQIAANNGIAEAPGAYDRLRGIVNPEAGGTLDRAFDFANENPYMTAGGAGALYGALSPMKMDKEEEEEESPLAGYARKDFTAYEAPRPNPYPQAQFTDYFKYGKEGGVMQSYADGGITNLAAGGSMAGQSYPQGLINSSQYALPTQTPISNEIVSGGYEPEINTYTGARVGPGMAEGGITRLASGGQVYYDADTGQYYTQSNAGHIGAMGFGERIRNYIGGKKGNLSGDVDSSVGNYNVAPVKNYYNAKYRAPSTPLRYSGPQGGIADYYTLADSLALLTAADPDIGAQFTPSAPTSESMASGGIAGYSLGGYAAGGNPRLLKGPGDGMSDNIPATIGGKQPARLADGEFVVPADVVSHLGNGSTDAGAKHLYNMMDKVRKARTGNKKQGKQINPSKFMPR
jgi:hypothetical protein